LRYPFDICKIANVVLSQYIASWAIFGFCHTISPPARIPNND
jgi:hypothetical protein